MNEADVITKLQAIESKLDSIIDRERADAHTLGVIENQLRILWTLHFGMVAWMVGLTLFVFTGKFQLP